MKGVINEKPWLILLQRFIIDSQKINKDLYWWIITEKPWLIFIILNNDYSIQAGYILNTCLAIITFYAKFRNKGFSYQLTVFESFFASLPTWSAFAYIFLRIIKDDICHTFKAWLISRILNRKKWNWRQGQSRSISRTKRKLFYSILSGHDLISWTHTS